MTEYLLLSILFLALITYYLHNRIVSERQFDKVVRVYLGITIIDASNMIVGFYFFAQKPYFDWMIPFGLIYGPLFYFAYQVINNQLLRKKTILIHTVPFILFLIFSVVLISNSSFRTEENVQIYFVVLHASITFSMLSYGAWVLLYKGIENGGNGINSRMQIKEYISTVSLFFIVISIGFIVLTYMVYTESETVFSFQYVHFMMFMVVLVTFRYTVRRISEQHVWMVDSPMVQQNANDFKKEEEAQLYQKSSVSNAFLDNYEEKLNQKIKERVYLDTELTLDSLAAELKVTKHHLTQILNLGIGQSFNQYVNQYRIEHACKLLKDPTLNLSIEELALESGFNSKSSFNRNFKSRMGCTPSEFRLGVSEVALQK